MMFRRDSPQSPSLCDAPTSKTQETIKDVALQRRPTTPDDQFTFFDSVKDLDVKLCSADDLFTNGRLRPFKSPPPNNNNNNNNITTQGLVAWNSLKKDFFSAKGRASKHGCSAEYRRLEKDPSKTRSRTQMPKRVYGSTSGRIASRPKWYLQMFWSVRAPAEMEMSDIRGRLRRRSLESVGPAAAGVGEGGKRRWKFLSALSCRGHEEDVTPLELQVGRVGVS